MNQRGLEAIGAVAYEAHIYAGLSLWMAHDELTGQRL